MLSTLLLHLHIRTETCWEKKTHNEKKKTEFTANSVWLGLVENNHLLYLTVENNNLGIGWLVGCILSTCKGGCAYGYIYKQTAVKLMMSLVYVWIATSATLVSNN